MRVRILAAILLPVLLVAAWLAWANAGPVDPPVTVPGAAAAGGARPAPASSPANAPANEPDSGATAPEREAAASRTTSGFVVRGRAVSAVDTPVPGARLRVRAFAGTTDKGDPVIDEELTTDARGDFEWPLPAPTALTFLDLRGIGDRVRTYPETFVLGPGDAPPPPFGVWIIPLTAVVRGVVLDPGGKPLGGARVGSAFGEGERTGADGAFEVFVEAKKNVTLFAAARGFVDLHQDVALNLAKNEGQAELRMRAGSRIHGRVTDAEQRPVAGATVRTFHTIYADGAETDADGRFVLDNLDPSLASHGLFARKDGYVEAKADVPATAPDVEQDLVLRRGVEVRGVVVGPKGEPLSAATVFLGFSPAAYNRLDTVSQMDGSFVFPCVPAGEQTLNVERTGYAGKRQKVDVPAAPSAAVVVRVELDAGHFVAGRAIDGSGKPFARVSIAPRLNDEYLHGIRTKTDGDGRFRLDGLPANGLALEFYGTGVVRKQEPVASVDRDGLEVVLERSARMAGTVVDGRTGKPITVFRIRYGRVNDGRWADWSGGGTSVHDAGGVFRVDDEIKAGEVFAFEASADGFGSAIDEHVEAALDPDPAANVITLYPGRTIDGVVRELKTSLPIAGARVKAVARARPVTPYEQNDDLGRPIAETDARGVFRLENLGIGEYSLVVTHPDWLPHTHGPIQVTLDGAVAQQQIALDRGATVTVDLRDPAGNPLANVDVELLGAPQHPLRAKADAAGVARFELVAPGHWDVALVETDGDSKLWTFRRLVTVEREDCRVELVATDGDATLVVFVDSPEPLPAGSQILVRHKGGSRWARGAWLRPDRTVIPLLPARDLGVSLIANGWQGGANVTTIAGGQVEVRIAARKVERR